MSDTPLGGWWDENDYGDPGSRSIAPDTPSVCPTCKSPSPKNRRLAQRTVGVYRACRDPWHASPTAPGSSSPDTAALVARLRGAASMFAEDPDGTAWVVTPDTTLLADLRAAADALESLTRWKAEAVDVMDDWLNVWKALGSPGVLGESIAHASEHEVAKLTAERDALRADR